LAVDAVRVLDVPLGEFLLALHDVLNAAGAVKIARLGARHRHGGDEHGRGHPRFHLQSSIPLSVGTPTSSPPLPSTPPSAAPAPRPGTQRGAESGMHGFLSRQGDVTPTVPTLGGG